MRACSTAPLAPRRRSAGFCAIGGLKEEATIRLQFLLDLHLHERERQMKVFNKLLYDSWAMTKLRRTISNRLDQKAIMEVIPLGQAPTRNQFGLFMRKARIWSCVVASDEKLLLLPHSHSRHFERKRSSLSGVRLLLFGFPSAPLLLCACSLLPFPLSLLLLLKIILKKACRPSDLCLFALSHSLRFSNPSTW